MNFVSYIIKPQQQLLKNTYINKKVTFHSIINNNIIIIL